MSGPRQSTSTALAAIALAVSALAALPAGAKPDRSALYLWPAELELPRFGTTTIHQYPQAHLVRVASPGSLSRSTLARITAVEGTETVTYGAWSGTYQPVTLPEARSFPTGYYLLGLVGPLDARWTTRLEAAGLDILEPAAPYSLLVKGGGRQFQSALSVTTSEGVPVVTSVLRLPPQARLDSPLAALAEGVVTPAGVPGLRRTPDGAGVVRVLPLPGQDRDALLARVTAYLPRADAGLAYGHRDAFLAHGPELLPLLNTIEEIALIEGVFERELHNNLAAKDYILNVEPVWTALGWTGAGVTVDHNDSGVSTGHPDFPSGVILATNGAMSGTNNEHGTHTAGSVAGRGLAPGGSPDNTSGCGDVTTPLPLVKGMAPGATLVVNNIFDGGSGDEIDMMEWGYTNGAELSTNSWGYDNTTYATYSVDVDTMVRDASTAAGNQEFMIVFSAGNAGPDASTVNTPGNAKNVLTVGASQNDRCGSYVPDQQSGPSIDTITTFSSRGPSQGRVKPDVVAVGADVISVDSLDCSGTAFDPCEEGWDESWTGTYYRLMPGTSMSCPITAGATAVFYEFYEATFGAYPSPALAKAAMINGAHDIGVGYPSYDQGWGRIDLRESIEGPPDGQISFIEQSAARLLTTGVGYSKTTFVFSSSPRLKITLVWTDPPASAGSTSPLRNNLDLVVTDPNGTVYRGNQFSGAWSSPNPAGSDTANNVENVFVQSPVPGEWTLEVRGTNITVNPPNLAGQDWALVFSGDCADCTPLAAPTGLDATAAGNNVIDLAWNAVAGATEYHLYRGTAAGGPYSLVATVPAPTTTYSDTTVGADITYYYVVRSYGSGASGCESGNSNEDWATAGGVCDLPPVFAGIASATPSGSVACAVDLAWSTATAQCGGPVTYTVYRHTASPFTPDASNRIAAGVIGTSYTDSSGFAASTTYYYMVRAVDHSTAAEDGNIVVASAMPTGTGTTPSAIYSENFTGDAGTMAGFGQISFGGTGTNSWKGVENNCPSGTGERFRFGGLNPTASCTNDYFSNNFYAVGPNSGLGVTIPNDGENVSLSFAHQGQFESGKDGILLAIDVDGDGTYTLVPAGAFSANGYNGQVRISTTNYSAWTGTFAAMTSVASLDSTCNTETGLATGCAGQTVKLAWIAYTNNKTNNDGWWLDDIVITADVTAACGGTPLDVEHLTVTSKASGCTVEWMNPPDLPVNYGATRITGRTDTYPTSPADGVIATVAGTPASHDSATHAPAAGVTEHYRAYVNSAADGNGVWSGPGLTTRSAPQGSIADPIKWSFSTGATALSSPRRGFNFSGVYVASNDRRLYAMQPGGGGGLWPDGWTPAPMNAPAQMPPSLLQINANDIPSSPSTVRAAFAGSTDGHVYAFDADTGDELWYSADLDGMIVANPMLMHTDYGGIANLVIVGTRNAASGNQLCALDMADGSTAWCFDNGAAQGGDGLGIGIVSGPAFIDATWSDPDYPGWKRAFFASRSAGGGSPATLWCVRFTATQVRRMWAVNVGESDGAVTSNWITGELLLGTNDGSVKIVDPDTGTAVHSRSFADGGVKEYVVYDAHRDRLVFSTESTVWSVPADLSTGDDWSVALDSPSRPTWRLNTAHVYVGACTDSGCTDGKLVQLDSTAAWSVASTKSVTLSQSSWLGGVTIDGFTSPPVAHFGSASGRVYTVEVPLP